MDQGNSYLEHLKKVISDQWPDITVGRKLGSGATGYVFECVKKKGSAVISYAVKAIVFERNDVTEAAARRLETTSEEYITQQKNRAIEEIQKMQDLKSAHIVHINDFAIVDEESASYILIVMDLLNSLENLKELHQMDSREEAERFARNVAHDILSALAVCEKANVLHRDIKPENIFADNKNEYILGDFGFAKSISDSSGSLTTTGTSMYMAPEVVFGSYDQRADIYSLGITLYRLVNHWRFPFYPAYPAKITAQDDANAQNRRMCKEALPVPDNCSDRFASIILMMCAAEPERRFNSADAVLNALGYGQEDAVPVQPVSAGGTDHQEPSQKQPGKSGILKYVLAAAVIVIAACLVMNLTGTKIRKSTAATVKKEAPAVSVQPTASAVPSPSSTPVTISKTPPYTDLTYDGAITYGQEIDPSLDPEGTSPIRTVIYTYQDGSLTSETTEYYYYENGLCTEMKSVVSAGSTTSYGDAAFYQYQNGQLSQVVKTESGTRINETYQYSGTQLTGRTVTSLDDGSVAVYACENGSDTSVTINGTTQPLTQILDDHGLVASSTDRNGTEVRHEYYQNGLIYREIQGNALSGVCKVYEYGTADRANQLYQSMFASTQLAMVLIDSDCIGTAPSIYSGTKDYALPNHVYVIYQTAEADGYSWYEIGNGRWIAAKEQNYTTALDTFPFSDPGSVTFLG